MTAPWDDLVVTATVGTDAGRPTPASAGALGDALAALPAQSDAAVAVLDAAALLTVARRAGCRPPSAEITGTPAPAERRPALRPTAAAALRVVLDAITGDLCPPAVLPALLAAVDSRGYRLPVDLLPVLLQRAATDPSTRSAVGAIFDARGSWLAEQNPAWQVLAAHLDGTAPGRPALRDWWGAGSPAQKAGYLSGLRQVDPQAAGALLAAGWATLPGADRGRLLPLLEPGVNATDEALLESALDSESATLRRSAAELLAFLPGSTRARQLWTFARSVLVRKRGLLGSRWEVVVPELTDPALRRYLAGPTDSRIGTRVAQTQLRDLIAGAPLPAWTDSFGVAPAELIRGAAGDAEWGPTIIAGWADAAIRQDGDGASRASWARALLTTRADPTRITALWTLLPAAERCSVAVDQLRRGDAGQHIEQLLAAIDAPWPEDVAMAVGGWLSRQPALQPGYSPQPGYPPQAGATLPPAGTPLPQVDRTGQVLRPAQDWPPLALLGLLGERLPVTLSPLDHAAALTTLADRAELQSPWRLPVLAAATVVDYRRRLLQELR